LWKKLDEYPKLSYGAVLAITENQIPKEDWEKLDKRDYDALSERQKKTYEMLSGVGVV
jgi:hypothetical protein